MESNDRAWTTPKTTKLTPWDIAMPKVATALPSGLVVKLKKPEQVDPDAIERCIEIYRTACYGTRLEVWGFACILNELLVSPLSTIEVEENREDLHNLFIPILDSLDDRKWGSLMITRPYDDLGHENSIFADFWRGWSIAVRRAISRSFIDDSVPLKEMSRLLVEYAGSPEVLYKSRRRPEGELVALPVWVGNWFNHTENSFEPVPPSRHEIRKATVEVVKLSFALEITEKERRKETRRNQIGRVTVVEYGWLNMQVYLDEERNEISVCQLSVFDGWRAKGLHSDYRESGEELVDFALGLKHRARAQQ